MMDRTSVLALLLLVPAAVSAQFDDHRELPFNALNEGDIRFSLSAGVSKFVTTANRFLESKASLRFVFDRMEYGVSLRMNNQVDFELPVDRNIIDIDENQIIFIDPNLLQNQSYRLSKPVSLYASRSIGAFTVTADLSPVFRTEKVWTPIVSKLDSSTYSVTSYEDVREQADLVSGASVSSALGPVILTGGLSSLSLAVIGDARVRRSTPLPFLGAGWKGEHAWFSVGTTGTDWRMQHLQNVDLPWGPPVPFTIRTSAFLHQRTYLSRGAALECIMPLTARIQLQAGFTSVWSGRSTFSSNDLKNWYRSVSSPWDENMESRLPHSSAVVGIRYDLRSEEPQSAIQLQRFRTLQKDLYLAKRGYYAYNPVATITIRNITDAAAECQFTVEMDGGIGTYRTDRLTLAPDESREVPLYLYLAETVMRAPVETRALRLSVSENGRTRELSSATMTVHEPHHWDGDTRNLRFFLTPEEPRIIAASRTALLSSVPADSALPMPQRMFITLQRLITAIGTDLRAVSDPTSTLTTDRVQYPVETLEQRAGDCEDLVVYMASCLMSVGYRCAAVDLRPDPAPGTASPSMKDVGHVFLLVDTGIDTEYAEELRLTEVEWAARRSSDDRTTIWIPLETFMVREGFAKAFQAGAAQYFQFVIAPMALPVNGVRVVDF